MIFSVAEIKAICKSGARVVTKDGQTRTIPKNTKADIYKGDGIAFACSDSLSAFNQVYFSLRGGLTPGNDFNEVVRVVSKTTDVDTEWLRALAKRPSMSAEDRRRIKRVVKRLQSIGTVLE